MRSVSGRLRSAWSQSTTPRFCRRSAALVVGALAIGIVSGGAVRLSGSGLGCNDWPGCTSTSIVAPLQYHAWVEFGNRLVNVLITLGVVLVAIAGVRRRPRRRDLLALSGGLVAGIFAEVVLGGETVLHKLAPPFVMAHFLLAMVLLVNALVLYHRAGQPEDVLVSSDVLASSDVLVSSDVLGSPAVRASLPPARRLVRPVHVAASRCMLALTAVVVVLGTVVTSTGPHAGAPGVPRFRFSLHTVAQLHGTAVEVLLAVTVATLWSMHRSRVAPAVLRRGEVLLVVLIAQAAVGYTQYLTGDPVLLVGVHIAGATSVVVAMMAFNLGLYAREPVPKVQTGTGNIDSAHLLARI
jgi:cytochrome c oxidase assembly protein subunit 15